VVWIWLVPLKGPLWFKAWSPGAGSEKWCASVRGGAQWEVLKSLKACLQKDCGSSVSLLCSLQDMITCLLLLVLPSTMMRCSWALQGPCPWTPQTELNGSLCFP
jgi:hypothetical protein